MKVLHVLASPGKGGLEKVFTDLSNGLAPHHELVVMTPEGADALSGLSDRVAAIEPLPRGSRRNPRTLVALRRAIARLRPDIVHSHAAKATELVHWAARGLDLPHVATKHNVKRRWIFGRMSCVVAVSKAVAATVPAGPRVEVIYNGIEPPSPEPSSSRPETFTVISVGRLHPVKGFDRLIRTVAELGFPCRLLIVGDGPQRAELERLVERLDVADRIELLGHRDDVPELLAGAHLQVVASEAEGFGLVLLEGLFYANSLLSTRVGIAPEVLPDEMLSDAEMLGDAIARVRDDYPRSVARLAELRAEVTPRFRLERTVESHLSLYEELTGRARSGTVG